MKKIKCAQIGLTLSRSSYTSSIFWMICCSDSVHWFDKGSKYFIIHDPIGGRANRTASPCNSAAQLNIWHPSIHPSLFAQNIISKIRNPSIDTCSLSYIQDKKDIIQIKSQKIIKIIIKPVNWQKRKKNSFVIFHPCPIWNDAALDFFEERRSNKNENKIKNNKMNSDVGSVTDLKTSTQTFCHKSVKFWSIIKKNFQWRPR